VDKKRRPGYRKPCPDPPKGATCPLCGGTYVCLQPLRKKLKEPQP
jgi:hypothetical protein